MLVYQHNQNLLLLLLEMVDHLILFISKSRENLDYKTFIKNEIINGLIEFANKAEKVRLDEENEELELGEIPDEF